MLARRLIAALALVFFFLPIGLRAVGVTAHPFENRPLASFPKVSQGWDAFDQATRFFVDRMPLREQAVHANTSISEDIFHTTPDYGRQNAAALPFGAPKHDKGATPAKAAPGAPAAAATAGIPAKGQPGITVLPGKDGWLFLEEELARTCNLFAAWPTVMHRWVRLAQIIRASGRRVVIAIPPDKSTLYPEFLPDRFAESACAPKGRTAAWSAIEGTGDPAVLGLRKPLLAAKEPPPNELYYAKDTHWNTKGGTLGVAQVLERLHAGVIVAPGEIVKGRSRYTGDLTNLMGAPKEDDSPAWTIKRPGLGPLVETKEQLPGGGSGRLLQRGSGGPAVVPERTLLVEDSFGEAMIDALEPYVSTLSVVSWYANTPPKSLIAAIQRSDSIVLETVERDVNYKASDGAIITPAFLADLRRALQRR